MHSIDRSTNRLLRSPQSHPHGYHDIRIGFALRGIGGLKHHVFISLLRGAGLSGRHHIAGTLRGGSLTLVRRAKGIGSWTHGVWIRFGSHRHAIGRTAANSDVRLARYVRNLRLRGLASFSASGGSLSGRGPEAKRHVAGWNRAHAKRRTRQRALRGIELARHVASADFLVADLCILSGGREPVRVCSPYACAADGSRSQPTGRSSSEFHCGCCAVGRQDWRRLSTRPHLCSSARLAPFWRVGSWNSFAFGGQRGEDCPGRSIPGRSRSGS